MNYLNSLGRCRSELGFQSVVFPPPSLQSRCPINVANVSHVPLEEALAASGVPPVGPLYRPSNRRVMSGPVLLCGLVKR